MVEARGSTLMTGCTSGSKPDLHPAIFFWWVEVLLQAAVLQAAGRLAARRWQSAEAATS
jgi:hypothetical protein